MIILDFCLTTMVIVIRLEKKLVDQAQKALYSLYKQIRNINIPTDLQFFKKILGVRTILRCMENLGDSL